MQDGYDAVSGATSTIVFTGGNRVVSGEQTVTAAVQVIHGGVDITSELPASAFTWTRDSGRSSEDATWNAAHQNVKQVTLTSADMNGDVQIACSVRGSAATFGSITVGSDYAVSYTRSAADAGDTLSLSSGVLRVETASNTYSLDDGFLKVVSGFTGTVTASATVFAERPAKTVEFAYNIDGLRAEKKVTRLGVETTTCYTYSGKKLTHLVCGTNSMHFFYDAQGRPAIVQYDNGSTTGNYTYVHNLQGDIAGILDSAGTLVVEYHYDAWGKPLSMTGTLATTLGIENPFRYRGYVYDEETGYYYLRSRYYEPGLKRFINADIYIFDHNSLFTYCGNNPINLTDQTGCDADDPAPLGSSTSSYVIEDFYDRIGSKINRNIPVNSKTVEGKAIEYTYTKITYTVSGGEIESVLGGVISYFAAGTSGYLTTILIADPLVGLGVAVAQKAITELAKWIKEGQVPSVPDGTYVYESVEMSYVTHRLFWIDFRYHETYYYIYTSDENGYEAIGTYIVSETLFSNDMYFYNLYERTIIRH